jgi:hypothetical protein
LVSRSSIWARICSVDLWSSILSLQHGGDGGFNALDQYILVIHREQVMGSVTTTSVYPVNGIHHLLPERVRAGQAAQEFGSRFDYLTARIVLCFECEGRIARLPHGTLESFKEAQVRLGGRGLGVGRGHDETPSPSVWAMRRWPSSVLKNPTVTGE